MKSFGVTCCFFLIATCFHFCYFETPEKKYAETIFGSCTAITTETLIAFQKEKQVLLFFKIMGKQGPIEGAFLLENEILIKVILFKSREGRDLKMLQNEKFLQSFSGKNLMFPIQVDVVSGATLSSQLLIDHLNFLVQQWKQLQKQK